MHINGSLNLTSQLKEYYVPILRAAKLGQNLEPEYEKLKANCQLDKNRCLDDLKSSNDFKEFLSKNDLEEPDLKHNAYFEYLFLWNFWRYADLEELKIERIPEIKNKSNPDFLIKNNKESIVVEVSAYDLPEQASGLIQINKPVIDFVDQITNMLPELVADKQLVTRIIGYKGIMCKIRDKVQKQLNQYCKGLKGKHRKILLLDAFYLIADNRLTNYDLFSVFHDIVSFVDRLGLHYYKVSQERYDEYCIMLNTIQDISNFLKKNDTLLLFSLDGFNRFQDYGLVAFNGSNIFKYMLKEFSSLSCIPNDINKRNLINLNDLFEKARVKKLLN